GGNRSLTTEIDRRRPKSIVDDRSWRYRPVAAGPRTDQLPDQYVLGVASSNSGERRVAATELAV
ncbi:hypothetical protein BHE74_00035412, partial [Ensete ventricosum]